ncbi:MAG TPA: hypothetical protein VGO67_26515 [Verrucomicrobiae bacterium]|jgi:hypothetical protein
MKKELFIELLESVKQAKALERGELKPAREFHVNPRTDIGEGALLKVAVKPPKVS